VTKNTYKRVRANTRARNLSSPRKYLYIKREKKSTFSSVLHWDRNDGTSTVYDMNCESTTVSLHSLKKDTEVSILPYTYTRTRTVCTYAL